MRLLTCRLTRLVALSALLLGVSVAGAQNTTRVPPVGDLRHVGRILGVFDENGQPLDGADVVDRIGGGTLRTTGSGLAGLGVLSSQHDSAAVFYTMAQLPSDLPHTAMPAGTATDGSMRVVVPCGALLLYSRHKI